MEKLNKNSKFNLVFKYALKDLSRNYRKISSIIVTLFISLFILSAIFTIEDSLTKELNDNAKVLLGGDLEIDYNRNQGDLNLVNKVKEFSTVSQMIEFSTMLSTVDRTKNKTLFTESKTFKSIDLRTYRQMLVNTENRFLTEIIKLINLLFVSSPSIV